MKLISLLIVIGIVFLYRMMPNAKQSTRSEYIDYYIDTNGDIVYHKKIDTFI